jgi:transposase
VLLKVHAGQSPHGAAREIGCHPSTACRIVARFEAGGEGSVFDGRLSNGIRKVSGELLGGIVKILQEAPERYGYQRSTWTLELLARVIAQELHVTLSVGHVGRVMNRLKVRWGMPRPVVGCPWPEARRKRRQAELRRLALHPRPREVVVYVDEVDIHLNPKIGRDWMLPGTQRRVMTPGKNQKHYLAGAYDPRRDEFVGVDGDRKATWLFLNLLRALWLVYRWARVIHVILDNYIIHKTARVEELLRQMGAKIRLHFLPPYCPNDNRIERLWQDLHANVTRNHRHRTMRELMAAVLRWLEARFSAAEVHAHAA